MELAFPKINKSYGGDQAWFDKKLWAAGGCGVIAGANAYFFFKGELSPQKKTYMEEATALYYWLKPVHFFNPLNSQDTYGFISVSLWRDRLLRFFRIRGLEVEARTYRFIRSSALGLVKEALDRGQLPIIMVLGLPGSNPYVNHFMTVTGYEGDSLIVSSWGRKITIPFKELKEPGNFFHLAILEGK